MRLADVTGVTVALFGGLARGLWTDPRTTQDVDLLFGQATVTHLAGLASTLDLIVDPVESAALAAAGMTRLRLPDHPRGRVRLDIVAAAHPYYDRALSRSVALPPPYEPLRAVSAEDLILLKVLADRPQDRADVAALLANKALRLDHAVLRREAEALDLLLPAGVLER